LPEHVHVHAPHELTEESEASNRHERLMEIVAVVLMSLSTVAIAWSGYQAARWSGLQAEAFAEASGDRAKAARAETIAEEERLQDLLNFNRWLESTAEGNQQLADLYERRFRPEFVSAFEAWLALDALNNPDVVASPLQLPEYQLVREKRSVELEREADASFDEGKDATETADRYIFTTVFLAGVLFFAGVSMRFTWMPARVMVLVLGGVFLAIGISEIVTLPTR
jgi:hypothetical protein